MRHQPVHRAVGPACTLVGRSTQTGVIFLLPFVYSSVQPLLHSRQRPLRNELQVCFYSDWYRPSDLPEWTYSAFCVICWYSVASCVQLSRHAVFADWRLFGSSLKNCADVPASNPFDTCWTILARWHATIRQLVQRLSCFVQKGYCSVRRLCGRVQKAILEFSCLLVRETARFIIRMQTLQYSMVRRQTCRELRAIFWRLYCLHALRRGRVRSTVILTTAFLAALGLGWFGGSNLYWLLDRRRDALTDRGALNAVVERIIGAESNGNPNAKNKRSSATGLGQFLNETWLEMIRAYRPDLSRGRGESEILELRRDPNLARELATRFAERNAAMLRQRGLQVTAGTVYLAHFAGGAGAVAILSAPENADAALVMASADATGRTKREKIIKANPFLERFTVADLKIWADRKMRGPELVLEMKKTGIKTYVEIYTDISWSSRARGE